MRMLRLLTFILIFSLLFEHIILTAEQPESTKLVVPIIFQSNIPEDVSLISEAVNRISVEKIGVSVECVPVLQVLRSSGLSKRRSTEHELLQKQGVEFDIAPDDLTYVRFAAIDDYLPQHGKDILQLIDEQKLEFDRIDGKIYMLPSVSDYVASAGVTMRKDIVDKYDIDVTSINSLSDLDRVLELVHSYEPDLAMICPYQTRSSFLNRMRLYIAIPNTVFDLSQSDAERIVNYYATDEYESHVKLFRKWHNQGYMPDNMVLQNLQASNMVRSGKLFAYFTSYKPDIDYEESAACDQEMITIPIKEPMITPRSQAMTCWGVSETCENPDKAVEFLNLLYSDEEIVNLLAYGIEGIHYERKTDGTIGYPDGMDENNTGYFNDAKWFLPNQFIEYVWEGNDPMLREKMKEYCDLAKKSEALYFKLDSSDISAQLNDLNEIVSKYSYGLETGQLDPDIYLPLMLEEMGNIGIEGIIQNVQEQYYNHIISRSPLLFCYFQN